MDEALISNTTPQSSQDNVNKLKILLPKSRASYVARHCAFCHQLCSSPAKLCGKCFKRAYCSEDCQLKDWSITGPGQRHKIWCGIHESGEEDVDWKVVRVSDKGLSIVAKKLLPNAFKIIVEAAGLKDLRSKMINHDCKPNAGSIFDDGAQVLVVYALRDIQPGEEILICYIPFTRTDPSRPTARFKSLTEAYRVRASMLMKEGIVCHSDCFCKDPLVLELVEEGIKTNNACLELLLRPELRDMERAIEFGEKLLDIQKRLEVSLEIQAATHFSLFNFIALLKSTNKNIREKGLYHLEVATTIFRSISPFSKKTKCLEMYLEDPEAAINTMLLPAAD